MHLNIVIPKHKLTLLGMVNNHENKLNLALEDSTGVSLLYLRDTGRMIDPHAQKVLDKNNSYLLVVKSVSKILKIASIFDYSLCKWVHDYNIH